MMHYILLVLFFNLRGMVTNVSYAGTYANLQACQAVQADLQLQPHAQASCVEQGQEQNDPRF